MKKIFLSIIIILVGIIIYKNIVQKSNINNMQILQEPQNSQNLQIMPSVENSQTSEISQTQDKEYPKTQIIEKYKNYAVCAKIEIPVIELETYILKDYSKNALNISPTKFWGANANEIGNFCVAGHNFKNKNMFRNLKKLNINDKIIVSDNNIGIVEYQVFDIQTVSPNDTNCLSQDTKGKREITLITCTNDSKKRIIVKARESDG